MKKSILKTIIETLTEQIQYMQTCLDTRSDVIDWLNKEVDELNHQIIDIQNREQQLQKMLEDKCNEVMKLHDERNNKRAPLDEKQLQHLLSVDEQLNAPISFIKMVRQCTGLSLKESKQFVDAHRKNTIKELETLGLEVSMDKNHYVIKKGRGDVAKAS